jgi:glycosyltransferase involved in cell wall biosynthesis
MNKPTPKPNISVVIPTFNRAELLRFSLESLVHQSLPNDQFEVIVIDDGSNDSTQKVCKEMSQRLALRYFRLEHCGISAAKNLGVFVSKGPLLLFFDDDDIADKNLLAEHVKTHGEYPEETTAVLGYTGWAPSLKVSEVMHYVTDMGHFLFSYGNLTHGQSLDFTYFWGGRSSCKRSFLARHGVFRQQFKFGSEDIELGYRLSKFGLKVIFNRNAVQYMNRPINYEEFCRRCEKQGTSQLEFSRLHCRDKFIQSYCQVNDAENKWNEMSEVLDSKVNRVREIEHLLDPLTDNFMRESFLQELWKLYKWTFNAYKLKGITKGKTDSYKTPAKVVAAVV